MQHQTKGRVHALLQLFLVCLLLLFAACGAPATANRQPTSTPVGPTNAGSPTDTPSAAASPTHTPVRPTNTPQPPQSPTNVASGGNWNFYDNTSFSNDQACFNDPYCLDEINLTTTTYRGAPAVSFDGQQYVFIFDGNFHVLDDTSSTYSITQHIGNWTWQLQRSFGNNFQDYNNFDQSGSHLTNGQPANSSDDIWVHAIFHANPSDCQGNGTLRRLRFTGIDVHTSPNLVTNTPYADFYLVCH